MQMAISTVFACKWVISVFARDFDFGAKSDGTDFAMSKNRFCLHTDFAGRVVNVNTQKLVCIASNVTFIAKMW
jgi:hypothetical protein